MPATFTLRLDTLGPADVTLAINDGAAFTNAAAVILNVGTSSADVAQMKVWGDLAGGPADEASAAWQAYNPALPVNLTAGDGAKTVTVRLRDDVDNPSATATDAITLDTTAPTAALVVAPAKISKQPTKRQADLTVTPNSDIQAWKVKVVPDVNAIHSAGTAIPATNGSVVTGGAGTAGVAIDGHIDGADLELAGVEGDNIIKAFVQDLAGNWSVLA